MSIEAELLKIKGNKELLAAEEVVDWARTHTDSQLHKRLEWNDQKAGHEYRIWQARQLIALHITYASGERKFVSLTLDRSRERGGYRDLDDVLRNQSLYEIMLTDALNDLLRVEKKYERLKELKPVWAAVRKIRSKQAKPSKPQRSSVQRSIAGPA